MENKTSNLGGYLSLSFPESQMRRSPLSDAKLGSVSSKTRNEENAHLFLSLPFSCVSDVCLSISRFCLSHKANSGPKAEWWPQSHSLRVWQWWSSGGQMLSGGEAGKGASGNWTGQDMEKAELGGG